MENKTTKDLPQLSQELETAKKNVLWLLENPDGLIDFHGLASWASELERLREEIKNHI